MARWNPRRVGMIATRVGDLMRREVPYDTGNMMRSVTVQKIGANEWAIIIPADKVPYTVYTVEPWVGRNATNPNLYWINSVAIAAAHTIASMCGGTVIEAPELPLGRKNENSGKAKKDRDKKRHREEYHNMIQERSGRWKSKKTYKVKKKMQKPKKKQKRKSYKRRWKKKIWSVARNLRRFSKHL